MRFHYGAIPEGDNFQPESEDTSCSTLFPILAGAYQLRPSLACGFPEAYFMLITKER